VTEAQRDGHLGLLGMRERVELLGGKFSLDAAPASGTTIRVTVPVRKSSDEDNVEFHL
jgi:signal transduction histidine kinase